MFKMGENMVKKDVSSFKIVQYQKHSWSYIYTIDGKKRDISGSSLHDLKRQVFDMGLPWDEENYPEETITKSIYDSDERVKEEKEIPPEPVYDGKNPLERESIPKWAPSMKNRNREFILGNYNL